MRSIRNVCQEEVSWWGQGDQGKEMPRNLCCLYLVSFHLSLLVCQVEVGPQRLGDLDAETDYRPEQVMIMSRQNLAVARGRSSNVVGVYGESITASRIE